MGEKFFQHPIGTGPFVFKSWNKGSELMLVRNPNHFRRTDALRGRVPQHRGGRTPIRGCCRCRTASWISRCSCRPPQAGGLSEQSQCDAASQISSSTRTSSPSRPPASRILATSWCARRMNYADRQEGDRQAFPLRLRRAERPGVAEDVRLHDLDPALSLRSGQGQGAAQADASFPMASPPRMLVDASTAAPDKQIAEYMQQQWTRIGITVSIQVLDDAVNALPSDSDARSMR